MDEVDAFCVRMLGPGEVAREASEAARAGGRGDRVAMLIAAAAECRERARPAPPADDTAATPLRPANPASDGDDRGAEPATEDPEGPTEPETGDDPRATEPDSPPSDPPDLAEAVAAELAAATERLPERQREALALRELLELSHEEVAGVLELDTAAVAPLLARARLRLRFQLRGGSPPAPECPERDRALRTIALRQDGEEVPAADDDWLVEHLGHCEGCGHAHAAMLEASACYRAWRLPEDEPVPAPA